jgi:CubicO group peptidase (beta-lactamase class C family)
MADNSVQTLQARLREASPEVEALMRIGGTPGAAIAILHEGELIYESYVGYRNVLDAIPVDNETMFPCASLTKAVVSAAIGICVDEGKFGWDTLVKDILPEFHTQDKLLHHHVAVADCLSHHAGMQSSLYWLGSMNNVLIARENSMKFLNDLKRVKPFRSEYLYNNLGYEAAAHILAKATGEPWERILHRKIFESLGMTRTGTNVNFNSRDKFAKTDSPNAIRR